MDKKAKLFFLNLSLLIVMMISCQKGDFDLKNPDVDQFISLLKDGSYLDNAGYELPDFKISHIEKLIRYVQDTSSLSMFPVNPLSSKYTEPKLLNECILWTIDGIRYNTKYPSLEPCLINKIDFSELTGYSRLSVKELLDVSDLYINWYNEYKTNPSEVLLRKNLLVNTSYSWN